MDLRGRGRARRLVVDRFPVPTKAQDRVLQAIAQPMHDRASEIFPRIPPLDIRLDWTAGREGRAFGFFDPATKEIAVSPRILKQPAGRIAGVIRHEIGHLVHDTVGRFGLLNHLGSLSDSDEVLADQVAEYIWGSPMFYDAEDVQTIDPEQARSRMRPAYLPNPQIETELERLNRFIESKR